MVRYRHALPVGVDRAWALVSDFGSILGWLGTEGEGQITLNGQGIGMTRDLRLPGVGDVQHRLDALDPAERSLTYSLTRGRPLGMARYSVTIRLRAEGEQNCCMEWEGEFDPERNAGLEQVASNLKGAYENMSRGVAGLLGRPRN